MNKHFDFKTSEEKLYKNWINNKLFSADEKLNKELFSILMPPPNVTGILHFGHVLNSTLQDIFIRRNKMMNKEVCWFPGLDHAGIATQTKVEKELKSKENLSKYDLGREKFLEKVWDWKNNYGDIILNQQKRLGTACDWDRTLFTMDENASKAVTEVFVRLFEEGLIYKGKRIINWSPEGMTALSDEEVDFKTITEKLLTLKYYFEDSDEYLSVATVRPETLFGDVAVAVNPNDERYKDKIGKFVKVPLVNRLVPIIADDYADMEFGTGCVKITPAHDPNDFEIGLRYNLEVINTINTNGTLNELTDSYNNIDRFEARKLITIELEKSNLIEKSEDYTHNVGYSQRGGEPIEPYLSNQWFVKMEPLAKIALKPVLDGDIKFYPNHWVKTYEHWLKNIKDWCISRQLWWGHRIPVYYSEDGRITAATNENEARKKLNLVNNEKLIQDEDVLDTWFSSWLWPLTTMDWLKDGKEDNLILKKFLPSSILVTAPDIIFFWVARMIMASLKFKNTIPFNAVYFTALIRDGQGRKLSKSLGNSPDPLNIIDKYGADAVRFTMIYLAPLGQDVRMDVNVESQDIPSMEIGRNFVNKIWNAGRFLLMKEEQLTETNTKINTLPDNNELSLADQWIMSVLNTNIDKINKNLAEYNVTEYSKILYNFIWRDYCDWYLEVMKVQTTNPDNALNQKKLNLANDIYIKILHILHPVMPFITDEIWHTMKKSNIESNSDENNSDESNNNEKYNVEINKINNLSLINEEIPQIDSNKVDLDAESNFEYIKQIIEAIRTLKASYNIAPSKKSDIYIILENNDVKKNVEKNSNLISNFVKANNLIISNEYIDQQNSISTVVKDCSIYVVLEENVIDTAKEIEKNEVEIERLVVQINGIEKKLSNETFVQKAPPKVIDIERKKLDDMKEIMIKLEENIKLLKNK